MKYLLLSLGTILSCCIVSAQSGLNSIYSAYGIGDVQARDYSGYTGMGGLGIALPSEKTLNDINPASYGSYPSNQLMLELSLGGKSVNYVNSTQNIHAGDFTIREASMGISLFKHLGTSFGIKRYSAVDYYTMGNHYLIGTESQLSSHITGTGGLYQFYLSNGVKIGKHLSLGLTVGYLSGSVNKMESIAISAGDSIFVEKNTLYQNFIFNSGIQYQFKTGQLKWIAGGIFQPQATLNTTEDNTIADRSGNKLVQENSRLGDFEYPVQWGAGLTMVKDYWKFGVDFIGQNWSSVNYAGKGFQTTSSGNWAAGFSYSRPKKTLFRTVEGTTYSAGLNYENSYLVINGHQIKSYAGTIGLSLPSQNGLYQYHFNLKVGQRGESTYPLVKEKFVEFNASFSLSSLIYTGGRKYY
ncbi:hypothetical protein [Flavihumibacter profundi]|uniref:hypothetical protein n=1 Tax=Flavihumibacter profundi TaxID=2716883 RepID=UPI001CC5BF67|nr:hypothetical protein [Flavihumibacter profundi]MBZ5855637.1 hypothetical protein [Flavihumibacter profundi]